MKGWITLHRQIKSHWIWSDPRKFQWWIDFLIRAGHKDRKILIKENIIHLKRGSFHTSKMKLADEWGVSRGTVTRFLQLLEQDKMITTHSTTDGTTVYICNYHMYQGLDGFQESETVQHMEQPTVQQTVQHTVQQTVHRTDNEQYTNNNDNNVNNENNDNNDNNNRVVVDYNNQDFSIIVNEWQKLGFGMITERSTEQILDWLKDHDKDLIMHVIRYAHDNGAINQRYVQAVLKSAREKNVKTVADFEAEQQKRAASRKAYNGKPNNQVIQPKWFKEQKETEPSKEEPKETDTDISNMINRFRKGSTP